MATSQEILTYFRGSELQNYFTKILEDDMKAIIKPQYVDHIPKAVRGKVQDVLDQKSERGNKEELVELLGRVSFSANSQTCIHVYTPQLEFFCLSLSLLASVFLHRPHQRHGPQR